MQWNGVSHFEFDKKSVETEQHEQSFLMEGKSLYNKY